jgi:ParB family chromosome partitioning protein
MTVMDIHARRDHGCGQQPLPVAPETGADAGAEEVLWVDPRELIIGDNVRWDAALNRGFVADIAERGVRQIIAVRRDESARLVVRTGQRRVLGAIEAGLARVRVLVETEQLTDARAQSIDRILDQLSENEHRSAPRDAEEAQATQLLLGLGLSARQIARRRHIPTKRVITAAAVAHNPVALGALSQGALDLAQAAVVAEFTDDEAAVAALMTAAAQRPEQFDHIAQQLRDTREETRHREQLIADLTDRGVRIIDRPQELVGGKVRRLSELRASPDTEPGTELTAGEHAGCPGHAAFVSERCWGPVAERVAVVWVCTDFPPTATPSATPLWA